MKGDDIMENLTAFPKHCNQGGNQESNQVCNQAINQGHLRQSR